MLRKPSRFICIACLSFIGFGVIINALVVAHSVTTLVTYPVEDFAADTTYEVLRVIDGDTVELYYNGKPTKFLLIGVDKPELVSSNSPGKAFGKEAFDFTRNLLLGESVYLRFDEDQTDQYDRQLAYLYRAPDGLFVNLELVRQGYGHVVTRPPFKHLELFQNYEIRARIAGKGLFGYYPPTPSNPFPTDTIKSGRPTADTETDTQVYVTRTGAKYHRGSCIWLKKSKIPISLAKAKQRYGPCGRCNSP